MTRISEEAHRLILDNLAENEMRPHPSMFGVMTILLVFRTGADQLEARRALDEAANAEAELRERAADTEWMPWEVG